MNVRRIKGDLPGTTEDLPGSGFRSDLSVEDRVELESGIPAEQLQLVRFGVEMEVWAQTDVGRYMVERATNELNAAVTKLLDMNDLQGKDAASAHFEARIAMKVLGWMNDAIDTGREAAQKITEEEDVGRS